MFFLKKPFLVLIMDRNIKVINSVHLYHYTSINFCGAEGVQHIKNDLCEIIVNFCRHN